MTLAEGVIFDEAKHEYFYKGKKLSGVTGLISKRLGLKYNDYVFEHVEEGLHAHKAVQKFIETGACESVHPGVAWLVGRIALAQSSKVLHSEVLVSDFKQYASSIDIVQELSGNAIGLYDIKKGKFNRDYVTWQLSVYKYFAEKAGKEADDLTCICLRDQEFYKIFPKSKEDVERLLYG